jgi:hypothetical protein
MRIGRVDGGGNDDDEDDRGHGAPDGLPTQGRRPLPGGGRPTVPVMILHKGLTMEWWDDDESPSRRILLIITVTPIINAGGARKGAARCVKGNTGGSILDGGLVTLFR